MKIEQYTYWSMTLNNPDDNDWLIVRNPNEKYVRALVWTREVGAEGTEHIQAWIRLQRNNSLTFMKKIFPRGHFKYITKDDYNENVYNYAQKEDETTGGKHHIMLNDPLPCSDTLLYKVLKASFEQLLEEDLDLADRYKHEGFMDVWQSLTLKKLDTPFIEKQMVMEKSGLEKVFVSPAYEKMKVTFWRQIIYRLFTIKDDAGDNQQERKEDDGNQPRTNSEDHEDSEGETDEGSSQSTDVESCEEDDSEEGRE